jgi:hypothetical protein
MTHGYSIFSYAMKKQPNEILIFWSKGRGYIFGVGGPEVLFKVPEITTAPVHICASWESVTGIVEFWLNGKPLVRKSEEMILYGDRGKHHSGTRAGFIRWRL